MQGSNTAFAHATSVSRGTTYRAEAFQEALTAALAVAGVEGKLRAFHDLRHSSLTLGAAAGEGAIALMSRAGHRNMATTCTYLHLAGTVFRDGAARLEERLPGSVESSTDLRSPERI
jgi:integrase